jgi:hypothetical protein
VQAYIYMPRWDRCMPINWYVDFVVCGHMYTQVF